MIIKIIAKGLAKATQKTGADPMLGKFVSSISYAVMLVFVVIASISQLGVQTASLVAILGAAGLAVGLALQGSLSNFAAGVMLIIFRPFNVGDFVEIAGKSGTVEELDIFTTSLRLGDKTKIIVPNGQALGGTITNFTEAGERRIEMLVGISYDADIAEAKEIILKAVNSSVHVLDDPSTIIGVKGLGDNSVDLVVRPWVKSPNFASASIELYELVKNALDDAGIGIPYPQRDLHIYKHGDQ
ncbi:UNVERIFIED_CONTAM: hypothetical protein GTU68_004805 [Idotea baltica]|nr:hypothetical protein [Idotea baltica]